MSTLFLRPCVSDSQNYVSVALCNVAAASHCEMQLLAARNATDVTPESADAVEESGMSTLPGGDNGRLEKDTNDVGHRLADVVSNSMSNSSSVSKSNSKSSVNTSGGSHGSGHSSGSNDHGGNWNGSSTREADCNLSHNDESNSESDVSTKDSPNNKQRDAGGGDDNTGGKYWLMTTDILRDIVDGCLASATVDVKANLIKAMNNLMLSPERRAALVSGNMPTLFSLVHGYTPEVRDVELLTMSKRQPKSQSPVWITCDSDLTG